MEGQVEVLCTGVFSFLVFFTSALFLPAPVGVVHEKDNGAFTLVSCAPCKAFCSPGKYRCYFSTHLYKLSKKQLFDPYLGLVSVALLKSVGIHSLAPLSISLQTRV